MHATIVTQPWEMVSVDLMGPKPRSDKGNTWLLVMQDRYTKWVELNKATSRRPSIKGTGYLAFRHPPSSRQRQWSPGYREGILPTSGELQGPAPKYPTVYAPV